MKRNALILAGALLAAALLGLSGSAHAAETPVLTTGTASDPLNIEKGTIVSNVFFNGESLSGEYLENVVTEVNNFMTNMTTTRYRIQSQDDPELIAEIAGYDFGMSFDQSAAEKALADKVLTGNLLERYKMAKDYQREPFEVKESVTYNPDQLEAFLKETTDAWCQEAKSASVSALSGRLVVTPGQNGRTYRYDEGLAALKADLDSLSVFDPIYMISINEAITEPALTTERAESFTIIGSYTTEYPAKRSQLLINREINLQKSVQYLSGHMFKPGEEISVNVLYGNGSLEHGTLERLGYLPAGTYIDGGHSQAVGGGLCQTTTTLYNAVLAAELKVIYRDHHRFVVPYVTGSRDAMVSWPDYDFKFVNTTSDYIILEGYVNTTAETITVYIIGHEDDAPGHSVRYETEYLNFSIPNITVQERPDWTIGFTLKGNKAQLVTPDGPQAGMQSRLWKIVSEKGVEVSRELYTSTDTYLPVTATYAVSPDVLLSLSVVPDKPMQAFLQVNLAFLDGTHIGVDPVKLSDDERIAFNERMTALCAAKGYTWPDQGNVVSMDGQQIYPYIDPNAPTTESESETPFESDSGESVPADSSGAAPTEPTPAPTPAPAPAPSTDPTVPASGEGTADGT